jgi:hypothetical protein
MVKKSIKFTLFIASVLMMSALIADNESVQQPLISDPKQIVKVPGGQEFEVPSGLIKAFVQHNPYESRKKIITHEVAGNAFSSPSSVSFLRIYENKGGIYRPESAAVLHQHEVPNPEVKIQDLFPNVIDTKIQLVDTNSWQEFFQKIVRGWDTAAVSKMVNPNVKVKHYVVLYHSGCFGCSGLMSVLDQKMDDLLDAGEVWHVLNVSDDNYIELLVKEHNLDFDALPAVYRLDHGENGTFLPTNISLESASGLVWYENIEQRKEVARQASGFSNKDEISCETNKSESFSETKKDENSSEINKAEISPVTKKSKMSFAQYALIAVVGYWTSKVFYNWVRLRWQKLSPEKKVYYKKLLSSLNVLKKIKP